MTEPVPPLTTPSRPRSGVGGTTTLAGLLIAGIGVVALFLLLAPAASGPIYTGEPPTGVPATGDLSVIVALLPLSAAAVLLVVLGAFIIPVLLRRLAAGELDPSLALAAAGRFSGRLRLVRILPVLRVATVAVGAILTALSVVITLPELFGRLGGGATPVTPIDPIPVEPGVPSGGIDPVTLLAMGTGIIIFGGLLLLVLPSITRHMRLPRRGPKPALEPVVRDVAASPFVAHVELPPEIAALFPAPPRTPSRLERLFEQLRMQLLPRLRATGYAIGRFLRALLRGMVRATRLLARAVAAGVRAFVRFTVAFGAAAVRLLARTARAFGAALVAVGRSGARAIRFAAHTGARAILFAARLSARGFVLLVRMSVRGLVTLAKLIGSGITLGLFVLLLLLLTLLDLLVRGLVACVAVVASLLRALARGGRTLARHAVRGGVATMRWSARTGRDLLRLLFRGAHAIVRAARRVAGSVVRASAALLDAGIGTLERLIDAYRPPTEGGVMSAPATVLVVALAPQSGKSTVAAEAARLLHTPWINSSAVIAERLEQRLGLPAGRIAETRAVDHEAYRPALIEEGNRMAAEGTSPGVECVRRGYRVIDGIRRREELEAAIHEVRARGGLPIVICVRRPDAPALADNTESVALASLADVTIDNDGPLSRLRRRTSSALRRFRAL